MKKKRYKSHYRSRQYTRKNFSGYIKIFSKKGLIISVILISFIFFAVFFCLSVMICTKVPASTAVFTHAIEKSIPSVNTASYKNRNSSDNNIIYRVTGIDLKKPYTHIAKILPGFMYYVRAQDIDDQYEIKKEDAQKTQTESESAQNRLPLLEQSAVSANLAVKNETDYTFNVNELVSQKLNFDISKNEPSVLIIHTHATESYSQEDSDTYIASEPGRSEDINYNVVRVGTALYEHLKSYGINAIHDTTLHDYPSYSNSYKRTLATTEDYLKKYPSIKMVFDIHRDAIVKEDGSKIKLVANVDGQKCAQVMIVCGTNQANLPNDNWRENFKFALKIQNQLETLYPGLARPVNLRRERFNMHTTTGSLIFEIGTHGNTLKEALKSTEFLANAINKALRAK